MASSFLLRWLLLFLSSLCWESVSLLQLKTCSEQMQQKRTCGLRELQVALLVATVKHGDGPGERIKWDIQFSSWNAVAFSVFWNCDVAVMLETFRLPFAVYVLVETFLVALHISCQIQLQVGLGFLHPTSQGWTATLYPSLGHLRILNSAILWLLQWRLPLTFTSLTSSCLFVSIRCSRTPFLVGLLVTCVSKLLTVLSRHALVCLGPAVLSF